MKLPFAPLIAYPAAHAAALPPARALALDALGRTLAGADIQAALDGVLGRSPQPIRFAPADAALAAALAYGVLRLRLRLTWLLGQLISGRKKSPLPGGLHLVLLLAAYELTMLDRVPAYATVHWAVEAVKRAYGASFAGLANAVLRRLADLGQDARNPEWYAARLSGTPFLAVFHSLPEWIVDLWVADYGEEAARTHLAAHSATLSTPPGTACRLNTARPGWTDLRESLMAENQGDPVGASGLFFRSADGAAKLRDLAAGLRLLAAEGALSFQSAGAQDILERLDPENWPGLIWDACAGRGGKTFALIERGLPVRLASDPSARRLAGLQAEARRLNLAPPPLVRARAEQPPFAFGREGAVFNTILVDAPCSGLGTLARRPDILLRRSVADIAALAALQTDILAACLAQLRPGGRLAYITCTMSRRENEGQVETLAAGGCAALEFAASTPAGVDPGERFFCALLRRR